MRSGLSIANLTFKIQHSLIAVFANKAAIQLALREPLNPPFIQSWRGGRKEWPVGAWPLLAVKQQTGRSARVA